MIIDCISDLHGHLPKLDGGDLLIVAGDLTATHTKKEFAEFTEWYQKQEYRKKVLVAGNHDTAIENGDYYFNHDWMGYLCDSGTEFEGLKIWGSPWSSYFFGVNPKCTAFMLPDEHLYDKWMMIPKDTDILITHTPLFGTLDYRELSDGSRWHMGSKTLHSWIKYVGRPKIHVFGHIHECGGGETFDYVGPDGNEMMRSINCSYVNERYKPVNKPVTVVL